MPIARARAVVLLALIMITSLPLASQILATPEWKLKVAVDTAAIRLKPDLDGPIAATLPRETILSAYEASGAWYRVLATSTPGGAAVIGYIATSDVEVLEEKTAETADFWPIPEPVFRGLGLTFRFTGGLGLFRSADLDASMEGMAALAEEAILSRGLSPVTRDVSPLHSGAFMGGDVLWALSPRLSVGAGFSYTRANSASVYTYNRVENQDFSLDNSGLLQVYAYRLVASTAIPLNRTAGSRPLRRPGPLPRQFRPYPGLCRQYMGLERPHGGRPERYRRPRQPGLGDQPQRPRRAFRPGHRAAGPVRGPGRDRDNPGGRSFHRQAHVDVRGRSLFPGRRRVLPDGREQLAPFGTGRGPQGGPELLGRRCPVRLPRQVLRRNGP